MLHPRVIESQQSTLYQNLRFRCAVEIPDKETKDRGVCATIDWSVQSYSAYFYLCFPSLSLSAQLRSNQQLVSPLLPFLSFEEAHAIFCKRNSHLVSYHYLVSCQWTAMKPLHTQKTSPIPYTFLDSFAFSCPAFLS